MKFLDIPKFPNIYYSINVDWKYLDDTIDRYISEHKLDIIPDFQRGHVWTEKQQIAYVEFMLKIPTSGQHIYFNHPGWMGSFKGDFVLVDGLQRLTAALKFVHNELKAHGYYFDEFEDRLPSEVQFIFHIGKLKTRRDVLKWYIDFNSGGTPHTKEEIERVQELLKEKK